MDAIIPPDPGIINSTNSFPHLNSSSMNAPGVNSEHPVQFSDPIENSTPKWSGVVNKSRSANLSYRPHTMVDGELGATIKDADISAHVIGCEKMVVGGFVGKRYPFMLVKNTIEKAWKLKGNLSMKIHGDKAFILNFCLDEDRMTALEYGPVFVSGSPFFVIDWASFVEQELESIQSVPVWLKLKKVPVHAFNPEGLSIIASVVGVPLLLDGPTAAKTRMAYARVRVEVNPSSKLKNSILVVFENIRKCNIEVEYAWKPPQCSVCSSFCHSDSNCPNKKVAQPQQPGAANIKAKDFIRTVAASHQARVDSEMQLLSGVEKEWIPVTHKRKEMKHSAEVSLVETNDSQSTPLFPPGFEPPGIQVPASQMGLSAPMQNSFAPLMESSVDGIVEELGEVGDLTMEGNSLTHVGGTLNADCSGGAGSSVPVDSGTRPPAPKSSSVQMGLRVSDLKKSGQIRQSPSRLAFYE